MRTLVLIPAHNEAGNLPAVVKDIRTVAPSLDILIVDDGSEDETLALLPTLCVQWIRMPVCIGVGGAVRTGLRYARTRGYSAVVRLDGDGQHPAALITPLVRPILEGASDVVVGSRYKAHPRPKSVPFVRRLMHYWLGRILSRLTGRLVTDPTSGLWAFNSHAIDMLADHHPSGYPEPELLLFLSKNALRVTEVPVTMRERMAGRSSLTLNRTTAALGRLLLHLIVVPLRSTIRGRN